MTAKITLRTIHGPLAGREYSFTGRRTCVIGRAADCGVVLPDDAAHQTVSRHHCLLDINPPDICVRDFGSLNGTFVNDGNIGQRAPGKGVSAAGADGQRECDLKSGDTLRVGDTIFEIAVLGLPICTQCGGPLTEGDRNRRRCSNCRQTPATPGIQRQILCRHCGRDVSVETGADRSGEYICLTCREDPQVVLELLLERARRGAVKLAAIRGFETVKLLGRGGMGAVFLARNPADGRQTALKIMLPKVAANQQARALFIREAAITRILKHPNIVQLHNMGGAEGSFFFTLEYCNGGNVKQLMHGLGGKLSLRQALRIILPVLDGLNFAHNKRFNMQLSGERFERRQGVIHRDLKPANILLALRGKKLVPKIADYGLGKAFETAGLSGLTATGASAGSPRFMPRQQVLDFKFSRPEVDVWAAAASFYQMLTGKYPRPFSRQEDPWLTVLKRNPIPIRERESSIPEKLARVIDRGLIDQPEILFQSASEFKQEIIQVLR